MSNSVWLLSVRKKEIVFKKYPASKSKKKVKKKSTKKILTNLFFVLMLVFVSGLVSAALTDDLHVNIQTTDSSGNVYTGTFNFSFRVATDSGCANVVYHNWSLLTTDDRGIISYYIPSVSLDYDVPYWLCSYKYNTDNTLNSTDILKIARTPYAFRATDVNLSEVEIDSNLTMGSYNVSASWGFFDYLGNLVDRITKLFVTDIDFTGHINGTGNITTTGNVTASNFFGNVDGTLDGYDSAFFAPLNTTLIGDFDITGKLDVDGGWLSNGVTIDGGNIYAQTGYFYNITSLNVSHQNLTIIDSLNVFGNVDAYDLLINGTSVNVSGLIRDWNETGYIQDWNATGYIADWGYLDDSWNANYSNLSTGYYYALNNSKWSLNYSNFSTNYFRWNNNYTNFSTVYGYSLNDSLWSLNYSNFSAIYGYVINDSIYLNDTFRGNYSDYLNTKNYALNDSLWSLNYSNFSNGYYYALNDSLWSLNYSNFSTKIFLWDNNYSNFTTGWHYATNETLNSSGLIRDWNATGVLTNYTALDLFVLNSGDTMTGNLNMNSNGIWYAANGSMGIGTDSPDGILHIEGADNTHRIHITDSTEETNLFHTGGNFYITTESDTPILFYPNQTLTMSMDGTGNVGIGTASPGVRLDIRDDNQTLGLDVTNTIGKRWAEFTYTSRTGVYAYFDVQNNGFEIASGLADGSIILTPTGTGGVGIGTTSPTEALTLGDDKAISLGPSNGADATILKITEGGGLVHYVTANYSGSGATGNDLILNSVSTSNIMTWEYGGNVGIGTTSPGTELEVANAGITTITIHDTGGSDRGDIDFNDETTTRGTFRYDFSSDDFEFWNGGTQRVTIASTGEVGIGTASPQGTLHIDQGTYDWYFGGTQQNVLDFGYDTNADAGWWINYAGYQAGTTQPRDLNIGDGQGNIMLKTDGSTGNVGIGTASPTTPLDVRGTTNVGRFVSDSSASGDSIAQFESGAGNVMFIRANGNVGIGTASPEVNLHVSDGTNVGSTWNSSFALLGVTGVDSRIDVVSTDDGTWGSAVSLKQVDGTVFENSWDFIRQTNGDGAGDGTLRINYGTNVEAESNTNIMTLTSGGNVGIGTASPQNTLDVVGNANVTGNFTVDNTDFFVNSNTGGVGIGTSSPAANTELDISTDNVGLRISDSTDSNNARVQIGENDGNGAYMLMYNDAESNTLAIRSYAVSSVQAHFTAGNIGIGTTTPVDKLSVAGTINGTAFQFESPKTYYYSVNPSQFTSRAPATDDKQSYSGYSLAQANGIEFIAPVNLPDGANVTAAVVYGNTAATAETWTLERHTLDSGTLATMAAANIDTEDTTISNDEIDNSLFSYAFRTSSLDTGDTIYGARITYILTDL